MARPIAPNTEDLINEMVATGQYDDAADVIEHAVQLLRKCDHNQRIIASVREAEMKVRRGEGRELTDEVMEQIWEADAVKIRRPRRRVGGSRYGRVFPTGAPSGSFRLGCAAEGCVWPGDRRRAGPWSAACGTAPRSCGPPPPPLSSCPPADQAVVARRTARSPCCVPPA